eukprot:TRINITY_DN3373_c0_g1_i1.p1 TRINITY_DN3373_c0_g1~~TRINITY_DN3373_c0_g1_i1.p1  ORF type:complete len:333 (+),score=53.53 TRINITY_DN3373_c0_g1_i1:48-1046(+)
MFLMMQQRKHWPLMGLALLVLARVRGSRVHSPSRTPEEEPSDPSFGSPDSIPATGFSALASLDSYTGRPALDPTPQGRLFYRPRRNRTREEIPERRELIGARGLLSGLSQSIVGGSIPQKVEIKSLDVDHINLNGDQENPALSIAGGEVSDLAMDHVNMQSTVANDLTLANMKIHGVAAQNIKAQGLSIDADDMDIKKADLQQLYVRKGALTNMTMENLAVSGLSLEQSKIKDIEIGSSNVSLHGVDLKGKADLSAIRVDSLTFAGVTIGAHQVDEIVYYGKYVVVFIGTLFILLFIHLSCLVRQDILHLRTQKADNSLRSSVASAGDAEVH